MSRADGGATCDGWCGGKGLVEAIDEKGYAYCGPCGHKRKRSGVQRVRFLSGAALGALRRGETLRSFENPVPVTPPLPLCPECMGAIGGACGGPDAPYRPAKPGEACGAADCVEVDDDATDCEPSGPEALRCPETLLSWHDETLPPQGGAS